MKVAENEVKKQLKGKDKKKDKKAAKGRPTCKKDEEEEKKRQIYTNPKYKFLNIQMEKLENMYIVLTSENAMSNLNTPHCFRLRLEN